MDKDDSSENVDKFHYLSRRSVARYLVYIRVHIVHRFLKVPLGYMSSFCCTSGVFPESCERIAAENDHLQCRPYNSSGVTKSLVPDRSWYRASVRSMGIRNGT